MSLYGPLMPMSIIVGLQMRAARAALNWSIEDLAEKSGVSARTLKRLESVDGIPQSSRVQTLLGVRMALEAAGIEFVGTPDDGPGIRVRGGRSE
jgi:transcriptional regulator with XRE-family HTH domain